MMAYAPTLTAYTDDAPMPRVEVLFSSFAATTTTVDVYRLAGGREFKVRSAVKAATAGALSRVDHEVPFGVPVSYRAEMFDAAGMSLGFTDTATVTVDCLDTWVHNPLNPAGGVKVTMLQGAAGILSRPVQGEVFYPQGRRVGVVISGQRQGLRQVVLNCMTESDAETDKFAALVGDYSTTTVPVLCYRIASNMKMRIPRPLFAAVMDPREIDFDIWQGGSTVEWEATGDEVSPPTPALVVPLFTNADLNAFYATNALQNAGSLTNLAMNRHYELGGTA